MNKMYWNKEKTVGAKVITGSFNVLSEYPVIWTMELVYPHIIHSHLMTHRVFSRNTASSRAVPASTHIPRHKPIFKHNKSGMSPGSKFSDIEQNKLLQIWEQSYRDAARSKDLLANYNVHKQWVNRPTEPYELKKVIVTATEWDNFLWLRDHEDAQDEIRELAQLIHKAQTQSDIQYVGENQWHIPHFIATSKSTYKNTTDLTDRLSYSTYEAIQISVSAVAQVSYRKLDFSMEKAIRLWDLFLSEDPKSRPHGSVFEHIAKPMSHEEIKARNQAMDLLRPAVAMNFDNDKLLEAYLEQLMFCGNFKGWNQLRKYLV